MWTVLRRMPICCWLYSQLTLVLFFRCHSLTKNNDNRLSRLSELNGDGRLTDVCQFNSIVVYAWCRRQSRRVRNRSRIAVVRCGRPFRVSCRRCNNSDGGPNDVSRTAPESYHIKRSERSVSAAFTGTLKVNDCSK